MLVYFVLLPKQIHWERRDDGEPEQGDLNNNEFTFLVLTLLKL